MAHLVNLSDDPLLNEALVYPLHMGATRIGSDAEQDVALGGLNILPQHCVISNELVSAHDQRYLVSLEVLPGAEVYVNGKLVRRPAVPDGEDDDPLGMTGGATVVLHDGDRIVLGHAHLYLIRDPRETPVAGADSSTSAAARATTLPRAPVTPQDAIREYVRGSGCLRVCGCCVLLHGLIPASCNGGSHVPECVLQAMEQASSQLPALREVGMAQGTLLSGDASSARHASVTTYVVVEPCRLCLQYQHTLGCHAAFRWCLWCGRVQA